MALLHRAELRPSKLDLIAAWLPARPWCRGTADPQRVASFRFDDPAGAVGVETTLVAAGDGEIYQVPLTYRDAPLPGGEPWLVGTTEHSVLGPRWVYDACGDPVYVAALANAVFSGGGQAMEYFEVDGRREYREPAMTVAGSGGYDVTVPVAGAPPRVSDGDPTLIVADGVELAVVRRLGGDARPAGATLTGTWDGQPVPSLLATATPR